MARLPIPGADEATWGSLLNEFLRVEHAENGTLKFLPLNVKNFGAKGDGVTDDTAAIQAAINIARKNGGGTVFFPSSKPYMCAGSLNIDNARGVRIEGDVSKGVTITYTGSGTGSFITFNASQHCEINDVKISWNNPTYTGNLISTDWSETVHSDVGYIRIYKCAFNVEPGGGLPRSIIRFNRTISSTIRDCKFQDGDVAIRLGDPNFANIIQVENCTFFNQNTKQIVMGATESVLISGCNFEPLINGNAGAISQSTSYWSYAPNISCNWFGDVNKGTPGTWIEMHCLGGSISSNRFATAGGGPTDTTIKLFACQGLSITGNRIEGRIGIDFGTQYCRAVFIGGNNFQNTTSIANPDKNLNGTIVGNENVGNIVKGNLTVTGDLNLRKGSLYVSNGALTYKSPNGTVTVIAPL